MLRTLDLFSGIGGFSLGLERTGGFQTVAFCEIDPFCRRVLAKHWPNVPSFGDIRELSTDTFSGERIDVICGGFPCQDISRGGGRAGLDGARSGLWREFGRFIGDLRPSFAIVENSAEMLGLGMGVVLGDMAALGYDAVWHAIPARYVGAPHLRDRAWIVAYPNRDGQRRDDIAKGDLEHARGRASFSEPSAYSWWSAEPDVGRVVHGVPEPVDRRRVFHLGNAVVPQIAELIGRAILGASPQATPDLIQARVK